METTILAFAAAGALTSAALAQSVGEKTGVNSALGITPKTEDFIKEAARSDMLEIQAAKIAQQKGNPDEKMFAEQMITDHSKTTSELERLVPSSKQLQATGRLDQQTVADLGLDSSRFSPVDLSNQTLRDGPGGREIKGGACWRLPKYSARWSPDRSSAQALRLLPPSRQAGRSTSRPRHSRRGRVHRRW